MLIFKTFFKVLRKHLPVALIFIVAFVMISLNMVKSSNKEKVFEDVKLDVCVFDQDDTPESRKLCEYMSSRYNMVTIENDQNTITDALYYERADFIMTIEKGYAEAIAEENCDGLFTSYHMHPSYAEALVQQFLQEYVKTVRAGIAGGMDIGNAIDLAEETLSQQTEVSYAEYDENADSDFSKGLANYFNYMAYILISVIMSALCPVLLAMDKKDIRYRTSCSGIVSSSYLLQILTAAALFITGIWLVFSIVGIFLSGGMYHGKALLALLNSYVFSTTSAAITVFITSFSPSANVVNLMTQVVGLGMSFLCGIFIEQSLLSGGVLAAGRFLPAFWYIRANYMLSGTTAYDSGKFMMCIAIELGFAAAFSLLSLVVRKIKLGQTAVKSSRLSVAENKG